MGRPRKSNRGGRKRRHHNSSVDRLRARRKKNRTPGRHPKEFVKPPPLTPEQEMARTRGLRLMRMPPNVRLSHIRSVLYGSDEYRKHELYTAVPYVDNVSREYILAHAPEHWRQAYDTEQDPISAKLLDFWSVG